MPLENITANTFSTTTWPTTIAEAVDDARQDDNGSKKLLDLLQDAYDAGADPDLDFNDYLHHAIVGGRLHLEVI